MRARARRHAADDDPLETSDEHLGATRVDRVGGSSDGPRGVVPRGAISRTPAPGLDAGRTSARGDGDRARVRRLHGQVPRDGRLRPRLHGQGGGHATLGCARPPAPRDRRARRIQTPTTRDPPDRLRARSSPLPLSPSSPTFPLAAEAEFVAAFDSLLRNNRDQVPPQYFYERLLHILARRRDPVDPRTGVPAPPTPTARRPPPPRTIASSAPPSTSSDACSRATRVESRSFPRRRRPGDAEAPLFVRVESLTWTPLDSDRRARGHDAGAEHRAAPKMHERGANADWCRFRALTRAAGGDPTDLDALCEPPDNAAAAKARRRLGRRPRKAAAAETIARRPARRSRGARVRRAGGDTANANARTRNEAATTTAKATRAWARRSFGYTRACSSRTRTRASPRSRRASRVAPRRNTSREPAMESRGGSTTRIPLVRFATEPRGRRAATRATPVFVYGARRAPRISSVPSRRRSHPDRRRPREVLRGDAAPRVRRPRARAAAEADRFDGREDGSARTFGVDARTRRSPRRFVSRRDAWRLPESVSAAAHRLLSRLGDVLDLWNARRRMKAAGKIRVALGDATTRAATFHRGLADVDGKRAFLAHAAGPPTHELRLVRSVFRATVMARQAPGIMRPGLGSVDAPSGALDVFEYAARDARTALVRYAKGQRRVRRSRGECRADGVGDGGGGARGGVDATATGRAGGARVRGFVSSSERRVPGRGGEGRRTAAAARRRRARRRRGRLARRVIGGVTWTRRRIVEGGRRTGFAGAVWVSRVSRVSIWRVVVFSRQFRSDRQNSTRRLRGTRIDPRSTSVAAAARPPPPPNLGTHLRFTSSHFSFFALAFLAAGETCLV